MKRERLENLGKVKKKLVGTDEPLVIVGGGTPYLEGLEVTKWHRYWDSDWKPGAAGSSPENPYAILRSDFETNNYLFEMQQRDEAQQESDGASGFYVFKIGGKAPQRKHATYDEASDEADRLANIHHGETFQVLSVVETRKVELPFKWRTDFENVDECCDSGGDSWVADPTCPQGITWVNRKTCVSHKIPFCSKADADKFTRENPAPSPYL